jgi:hypothetical protein
VSSCIIAWPVHISNVTSALILVSYSNETNQCIWKFKSILHCIINSMPPTCSSYKILSYTFVGFLTVSYQLSALVWIFYNLYMTSVITTCLLSCFGCCRGLFKIYIRNAVFVCGTYRKSDCAGEGKGRFQHMFWYCTFPCWRSVYIIVSKVIRQSLFWTVKLFIL